MYSYKSGLIFGFHGCDEKVRDLLLTGDKFRPSENKYDWLGHGMYFWENNEDRALEFANSSSKAKPAVIGAVLNLGHCLDLLDKTYLDLLRVSYEVLSESLKTKNSPLPENRKGGSASDLLLRDLDCAVIEHLHEINKENNLSAFDSVKGVFIEGEPIYDGCGINNKNHIQICVRNPNCIKGFFLPRKLDISWDRV